LLFWSSYVHRNSSINNYDANSWTVLTDIERRIKEKIEKVGTPLKDWEIQINYGIKTGFNDAFIIDGSKRKELIEKHPKSEEIIRPILRGRDIKKFGNDFSDTFLICTFPSLRIEINNYPAIKEHFLSFGFERLKQTGEKGARKKTNNKWYEIQDSINYYEELDKPKIIYPEITKFLNFYLDDKQFTVNNKCFILTGKHIAFLTAFCNSSLFKFCFIDNFPELLGGSRELRKIFFEKIPIIKVNNETNETFNNLLLKIQSLKIMGVDTKEYEIKIDDMIFDLYELIEEEKKIIGFIEII